VTDRHARVALSLVTAAFVIAGLMLDLPRLTDHRFWNDGATYYSMARSLAEDGDVRFEARDLQRVKAAYPAGPQGIFLKRTRGGLVFDSGAGFPWLRRTRADEGRLYFAKPFVYPLASLPFVWLFGAPRGLLLTNAVFLGLALFLGYGEVRRRASPAPALAVVLVLVLGTVTPLYFFWLTPEIFGLGLITAGLVAWRGGRPLLSAVLLGIATYAKPTNLFIALPLCLAPILAGGSEGESRASTRGLGRAVGESLRRAAVLAVVVLSLFGVNALATGEMNYQGGERKTFYGRFPLEAPGLDFDNTGFWMTTDYVGPLVEGQDDEKYTGRTAPPRPREEIPDSFLRNLAYFWTGRFGGAVPYFFPAVLAGVLFLARGPRDRAGWLALSALLVSYLLYIWLIPDNWYGGGGTVGNRYFLNLLPLAFVFMPRGREWMVAGGGLLATATLLTPIFRAPLHHSLHPGDHATHGPFRVFPAEMTMLNDLSVFLDVWRKKRPYGDTEGDAGRGRAADPTSYYLYFVDDGTYGQESSFGEDGFWIRGGENAEVFLRALEPVEKMTVRVTGGPGGDVTTIRVGGRRARVAVSPLRAQEVVFDIDRPGYGFYDSFVYRLELASRFGGVSERDPRRLGSFVRITLQVNARRH
jgi:hypothetical protein